MLVALATVSVAISSPAQCISFFFVIFSNLNKVLSVIALTMQKCDLLFISDKVTLVRNVITPVVQRDQNAVHSINFYPADNIILLFLPILIHWIVIYPTFDQLRPGH